MLSKLCIIIFLLISSLSIAQNKITLDINKVSHCQKNELLINCTISSKDTIPVRLYKLQETDFCDGLARLNIMDSKSKTIGHYFPCDGNYQLDNIILNDVNTVELQKDNYYNFTIVVKCKMLTISLIENNSYKIQLSLNYNNLVSSNDIKFYNKRLLSNEFMFYNSKK